MSEIDVVAVDGSASVQRPPAEVRYADELRRLAAADEGPRPPGWVLSLTAARRFIVGDQDAGSAASSSATPRSSTGRSCRWRRVAG
ncbi:hypothetical protein GCM10020218_028040 [Dactylosporangium vinaceum]